MATTNLVPAKVSTPLLFSRGSARVILTIGMIINVLLFVRVAILYNPGYSYLGPTGADRVFYYMYVRSLVIDGDLDFSNEIVMRPPSSGLRIQDGKPVNKYPIGMPLLSLPAYALTHLIVTTLNTLDWTRTSTDGYSAPYVFAFLFSQMAWALVGLELLYRALLRYYQPLVAAFAVVSAWIGTNILHYTAVDLLMSHAAALFSGAWCFYEATNLRKTPFSWQCWLRLGASSGLLLIVRYQNGIFLLLPLAAAVLAFREGWKDWELRKVVAGAAASIVGFLCFLIPQLLVWKIVFNTWFANSYGDETQRFAWFSPHLAEGLFDAGSGLFVWLPIIVLSISGCLALVWTRRDLLAAAAVCIMLGSLYVTTAWWCWEIIPRTTFDMLAPFALGLGFVFSCLANRSPWVVLAVVAMLLVWNVPFAALGVMPSQANPSTLMAAWWQNVRAIL